MFRRNTPGHKRAEFPQATNNNGPAKSFVVDECLRDVCDGEGGEDEAEK